LLKDSQSADSTWAATRSGTISGNPRTAMSKRAALDRTSTATSAGLLIEAEQQHRQRGGNGRADQQRQPRTAAAGGRQI